MAVLLTPPFLQFFDEGVPLAGGKVYAYAAGTTTPKATYTTAAGNIQHANPIVLDSSGNAVIFIEGAYRFDVFNSADELIRSVDNVTSFTTLTNQNDAFFQSFSGNGSEASFTLSEAIGGDPKNVMVFVDNGLRQAITNSDFATDTVWAKGAGWTIAAGVATATGGISTGISQTSTFTLENGRAYRVTYTITRSAGGIIPSIGDRNGTERTVSGTYTDIIIADATQVIAFTGNAFTGTLDTISVNAVSDEGYEIQSPNNYTVSGSTITFATAPATGTNNIYVFMPSKLLGAASSAAAQAAASEAAALQAKTDAEAAEVVSLAAAAAAEAWAALAGSIAVPDGSITLVKLNADVVIDEDSFATDSATRPPSQQSTKAYVGATVDAAISGVSQGVAKAWVNFNGTNTVAIRDSYNVSSITDNGTGDYTVNFTTAMANANYSVVAAQSYNAGANVNRNTGPVSFTTSSVRIISEASTGARGDSDVICVAIYGD